MAPKCPVCDSQEFNLEDGLFYCSECNTQSQDFREEAEEAEYTIGSQWREVSTHIKKSCFVPSDFKPWFSVEAFNVIIKKQVDALIGLGSSIKLYDVVLQLWSAYLYKCEIAFREDGDDWTPRLPTIPRFRDFEILKGSKILSTGFKEDSIDPNGTVERSILQNGKRVFFKRKKRDTLIKKILKAKLRKPKKSKKSKNEETEDGPEKSVPLECQEDDRISVDGISVDGISVDGISVEDKTKPNRKRKSNKKIDPATTKDQPEIIELDSSPEKGLKKTDVESMSKLFFESKDHFSAIAQRAMENEDFKELWKRRSGKAKKYVDSLTLIQTIAFCYAGILILQEPILLSDIMRWMREGRIPFFHAWKVLPSTMLAQKRDFQMFRTTVLPERNGLLLETKKLLNFLSFKEVPCQSVGPIILRVILDLNLPYALVRIVNNLIEKLSSLKSELINSKTIDLNVRLPQMELQIAALVIVVLKILFGLDGKTEYGLSRIVSSIKPSEVDKKDYFNWSKWESDADQKLKLIKTLFPDSVTFSGSTCDDIESFYTYYKEVYTSAKELDGNKLDDFKTKRNKKVSDRATNLALKKLFVGLFPNGALPAPPTAEIRSVPPARSFPMGRIEAELNRYGIESEIDFSRQTFCSKTIYKNHSRPFWLTNHFKRKNEIESYFQSLPNSFKILSQLVLIIYESNLFEFWPLLCKMETLMITEER